MCTKLNPSQNWQKSYSVGIAALHITTAIDKEFLEKPPLTNIFFSCVETAKTTNIDCSFDSIDASKQGHGGLEFCQNMRTCIMHNLVMSITHFGQKLSS